MDQHEDLEQQIAQLKSGLQTRGRVGMALGIIMERYELDEDRAFRLLVRISQHENRKLHTVAEDVIAGRDLAGGDSSVDA
ncbi:hypothetical protein ASD11_16540 [Aeromicrobium sp. Root495]|uniref:ANTAR domain-containing protein n=1 Tax=Aeromicrobium sp. Root495 TaxID=1736550 RepID=UPI0006F61028|nr:ANTAR domain-containing protein [Aeromicrobium sp. Root495]KQY56076.1 hypothetical protein ASD11_16540 [Aeromicrobium sp. Root495]